MVSANVKKVTAVNFVADVPVPPIAMVEVTASMVHAFVVLVGKVLVVLLVLGKFVFRPSSAIGSNAFQIHFL